MQLKISGSFRRYYADPTVCALDPDPLLRTPSGSGQLEKVLQEGRFRSIENSPRTLRSVGWTTPEGLVPANFAEFDPWLGIFLVLGVRVDVKRIPAGALQIRRREWEAAERKVSGERIAPDRRREVTEKIEEELLARSVPSTSVTTMYWDTQSGELLFSATADAVNVAFRALFQDTFGRSAEIVDAGSAAERWAARAGRQPALLGAMPLGFLS